MVLLVSLVFLLLLTVIGLSSMQAATSQEKVAGSLRHRIQSFQAAESGLRLGESTVQAPGFGLRPCVSIAACVPPVESMAVSGPGVDPVSTVSWVGMKGGVYGIQNLGPSVGLARLPPDTSAIVYRVTAVGLSGQSRTVLESVLARVPLGGTASDRFLRIMWRQIH